MSHASTSLRSPGLQILVRREFPKTLSFEARSEALGLHNQPLGSLSLEGDPKALAQEELGRSVDNLSDLAEQGEMGQESAREHLADLGINLFQKLPQKLRELLWTQQGEIETIQILSDEPYIPWELLKLQGEEGEEGPFLCAAFTVTRWLRESQQTAFTFPLQRIALLLSPDSDLPSSTGEKEDLLALAGKERITEIEPDLPEVKKALAGGDFDGWHLTGHGSSQAQDPDGMGFLLADRVHLTPSNLASAKANFSRLQPLIFLNGCGTGRGGFSLTGMGGWAQKSLAAGAGAFLGTLWPVRDKKARAFAQAFYHHFLRDGRPIGEAVRQARLHVREQFPGDPAWLAYTVYAHPGAICSTASGKPGRKAHPAHSLRIPELEWHRDVSSPGTMLRAEYGIVPFHGREKEKSDLSSWCIEGPSVRVRLYTGPGGMGKTRLAFEMAKALRSEGWRAGFLEPEAAGSDRAWQELSRPGGKVLAIVDYAETRRDLLVPLLRRLSAIDAGPVRLVLLARAALDWWEQLKMEVGDLLAGPATTRHSLRPLAFDVKGRSDSFWLAGQAFADRLSERPPAEAPDQIDASHFERVLLLHMAAYLAVAGKEKTKGEDGILDEMLRHEKRYWRRRAVDDKKLNESLLPGISRAMAAITLGGGVRGEAEAVEVLRHLRAFEGHTGDILLAVAHLLHECYPGDRWIEPILPDLLGEHLVQRELENGADELLDLVLGPSSR